MTKYTTGPIFSDEATLMSQMSAGRCIGAAQSGQGWGRARCSADGSFSRTEADEGLRGVSQIPVMMKVRTRRTAQFKMGRTIPDNSAREVFGVDDFGLLQNRL